MNARVRAAAAAKPDCPSRNFPAFNFVPSAAARLVALTALSPTLGAIMKYRKHFPYLIISALAVLCAAASAQSGPSHRLVSQSIGNGAAEPLGDREGHAPSVGNFTCRIEGGPLDVKAFSDTLAATGAGQFGVDVKVE